MGDGTSPEHFIYLKFDDLRKWRRCNITYRPQINILIMQMGGVYEERLNTAPYTGSIWWKCVKLPGNFSEGC